MHFLTNHDENSWNGTVFERLGEGHRAFAVLSFTVPGMPLIYSGQEAGLKKRLSFFDKDQIDWSDQSMGTFYGKLNQLKNDYPVLWNGNAGSWIEALPHDQKDHVLAYRRGSGEDEVLVILNLSAKPQTVSFGEGVKGKYKNYLSNEKVKLGKKAMELEAWGYRVLGSVII